jgi:hypothetical protein
MRLLLYFTDPEDIPVGAIRPRQDTSSDGRIAREDDDRTADLTKESTVAAQSITIEFSHARVSKSSPIPMRLQRAAPLQRAYSRTKIARWNEPQTLAALTAPGTREDIVGVFPVSPRL